jgi:hypothetical protein
LFICLDLFFWPNQVGKMLPGRSMTEKTAKSSRKHPDQIQPLKSNQNPKGMVHVEEAPQVHAEPTSGGDEHETDLGAGVEELEGAVVVGEDR